jgi:hypothetical protein
MAQSKSGDDNAAPAASQAPPGIPSTGIAPAANASAEFPPIIPDGFHQILIRFQNLMVEIPHVLTLRPNFGVWHLGVGSPPARRLILATPGNEAVHLKQMAFTATTMTLEAAAPMRALDVTAFVQTSRRLILGGLALPPGATVALRSSYDRTNVVGVGSWALLLGDPE